MYQYCPKCKKLIQETDTCPHCNTPLNTTQPKPKLTTRQKTALILAYLVLAFAAFYGRNLTNTQEIIEGTIMLAAFTGLSIFWYYLGARGGIGYPIK